MFLKRFVETHGGGGGGPHERPATDECSVSSSELSSAHQIRNSSVNSRAISAISRNLGNFVELDEDDLLAIGSCSPNPQRVRANQILFHERNRCDHIVMVVEGFACRYKILPNGRRQIFGYMIPGDLCDINFLVSDVSDHGVAAVGDSLIAKISIQQFAELAQNRPNIHRAVSLAGLRETLILREWLLNVGRRNAFERLCHFFCEIFVRMNAIGQSRPDGSIHLPVNQAALADTIGLTEVHVNRTLQRLRAAALIDFRGGRLHILDYPQLAGLSEFDDHYLGSRTVAAGVS